MYTSKYDNLLFYVYFYAGAEDFYFKNFCLNYDLANMVNKPTCYKNPPCLSCIDLFLTNCTPLIQSSCMIKTELLGFHKMVIITKINFRKPQPKISYYLNYNFFSNNIFRESLQNGLQQALKQNCNHDCN